MTLIMATPQNAKVARSRERMRAAGLRPVQFWVPDTREAALAQQLRQQCLALTGDAHEAAALHMVEEAAKHTQGWA